MSPETPRLLDSDNKPIFLPRSTAIYAEKDGQIRGGAIVTGFEEDGPQLTLRSVGFSDHLTGQPYTEDMGPTIGVDVDPLDLARLIWGHRQAKLRGNIGMILDKDTSPVRVGTPLVAEGETQTGSGPYRLSWWETFDLGREFDDLAKSTPFDYRVTHEWGPNDQIIHRLHFGYPALGARRDDLRFVVGENIFVPPALSQDGEDYADEVIVLGSGEGPKMIRSTIPAVDSGRLHHAVVVEDKSIQTVAAADARALEELDLRRGESRLPSVTVRNHDNAPLGDYTVGDEIAIQTERGWSGRQTIWVRILAITISTTDDTAALDVERV